MRSSGSYKCSACLREGSIEALCEPRCATARDENGNRPPPQDEERYEWFDGMAHLGARLGRAAFLLTMAVRRLRRRRQLKKLFAAAGAPVPIADAREGLVTIEGVIEAVTTQPIDGEPAVAYVERELSRMKTTTGTTKYVVPIDVTTLRRFYGRFTVKDGSGEVLVDDDWLLLLDDEGEEVALYGPSTTVAFRHGDRVRVTGLARPVEGWKPSARSSFRGHVQALEIAGATNRPVCLRRV